MRLGARLMSRFSAWSASILDLFIPKQRLGAFRLLYVYYGGCPVACCLPLALVLVTEPSCRGSFILEGGMLVGLGCPAERADTGSDRLFCGRLRCRRLALRRGSPLADGGRARIVVPHRAQLVLPRADSGKALPDILLPALPGLRLAVHASSMPAPDKLRHAPMPGSCTLPQAQVHRASIGPGLWPGPRREARWAGRGLRGQRRAEGASRASGMRSTVEAGGASPDNARRSGPLAVTSSPGDRRTGATLTAWPWCWRARQPPRP